MCQAIDWLPLLCTSCDIALTPSYSLPAPPQTKMVRITAIRCDALITIGEVIEGVILPPLDKKDNMGLIIPRGGTMDFLVKEGVVVGARSVIVGDPVGLLSVTFF